MVHEISIKAHRAPQITICRRKTETIMIREIIHLGRAAPFVITPFATFPYISRYSVKGRILEKNLRRLAKERYQLSTNINEILNSF